MAYDPELPDPSKLVVDPNVVDFLIMDEQLAPGSFSDVAWDETLHDQDLVPLLHGALVYIHRYCPGTSPEALARAQGIREGLGLAIQGLKQSREAEKQDSELLGR
jgi:hypothetical protein